MAIEGLPDWAKGAPFIGPVLCATATNPFDTTQPLCVTCPVGQWYRSGVGLRCFCTAFRTEMFGRNLPIVLACDAYEYALLEVSPTGEGDADQRP